MKLPLRHTVVQGVSVVIVTFNGTSKLKPTLEHLAEQQNLSCPIELLLIDNNSNDGTQAFVMSIWEQLGRPYPLRVLTESNPGTMNARQKGIEEAYYRYILFCDDDNWLHSTYVETAYKLICNNEKIAAIGGLGIITYKEGFKVPSWMCEQYERSFGTGSQGEQDGDTTNAKGSLYTAGAIFDRQWLDRLYGLGFITALKGRDGKSLVAGEDTELTIALSLIGGKLYYSSKMHFKHFMPPERINWSYLKKLWFAFGQSDYILTPFKINKVSSNIFRHYYSLLKTVSLYGLSCIKIRTSSCEEGDQKLLELQMLKGKLYAMTFKYEQFKNNDVMAKRLKQTASE